jgi:hypothetical protein
MWLSWLGIKLTVVDDRCTRVETVVGDGCAGAAARLGGVKGLVCSLSTAVRYRVEGTISQGNTNGMAHVWGYLLPAMMPVRKESLPHGWNNSPH